MTNDITNDTSGHGGARRTVRGHLASVPAGDWKDEAVTADVAPDSMSGLDIAGMFRMNDQPAATAAGHMIEEPASAPAASAPAALEAATADFWAADCDHEWNDNDVADDEAPAWDQTTTIPAAPADPNRSARRRPLGWLALIAVLALLVAGGLTTLLGGGGVKAKTSETVKRHSSTPAVTLTTRAHTVTVWTTPARATAKPRVRRHHKKHVEVNKTVTSQAPVTTTAATVPATPVVTDPATSTVPTHSTPVASPSSPASGSRSPTSGSRSPASGSSSPASGSRSTESTEMPSNSGGSSKKSSAGSGAVPTGALPGIQQTEQQP